MVAVLPWLPWIGALVLLVASGASVGRAGPAGLETLDGGIALRCQVGSGSWRDCRMVIDRIGEHWWLVIGERRFEFRHDGRGSVTMAEGTLHPRAVTTKWRSSGVLCWDGICAEGPIPLD